LQQAHRLLAAATRNAQIAPFYVMEVMKAADALEAQGRKLIHLSIGEPDFTAPPLVQEAAARAIREGRTQYTHAAGLDELREKLSAWYLSRFGVHVPARRIFITAGASGALLLACSLLVEPGTQVLMPDPCYSCNKHFVANAGGVAKLIACDAAQRFQLTADDVRQHWNDKTGGVLLASPSNPTGTSILPSALKEIAQIVQSYNGYVIADEIYLGLSYEAEYGKSALLTNDNVITINSFSKYFHMTGWRLGWMVVPDALVPALEKLAQNLFICASSVSQQAALACFEPESLVEFEARRAQFKARRDYMVPALNAMGLTVPVTPDGAFYVYGDCSAFNASSWDFAFDVMRHAGVVLVPGKDFGDAQPERYFRVSYANCMANLQEAVHNIKRHLHG
jgi:aspartate/methionine/tyrosine aminotransferase